MKARGIYRVTQPFRIHGMESDTTSVALDLPKISLNCSLRRVFVDDCDSHQRPSAALGGTPASLERAETDRHIYDNRGDSE